MAYTKAQREAKAKEVETEEKLKAELEEKFKAELEAKIRKEYEEKAAKTTKTSKIPLTTVVEVTCNVIGTLNYEPKNGGAPIEWDGLGSTEYMELSDLVTMRNGARRFFEDNWIILEDTDEYTAAQLYDFLKVSKYYKDIFTPDTFDEILKMTPKQIIKTVNGYSKGVKDTISTMAKAKIDAGELDSKNRIEALEEALNVTFSI